MIDNIGGVVEKWIANEPRFDDTVSDNRMSSFQSWKDAKLSLTLSFIDPTNEDVLFMKHTSRFKQIGHKRVCVTVNMCRQYYEETSRERPPPTDAAPAKARGVVLCRWT